MVAVAGTSLTRSPSTRTSISSPCRLAAARPIAAPRTRTLNEYSASSGNVCCDQRPTTRAERQTCRCDADLREIAGHAIRRRRGALSRTLPTARRLIFTAAAVYRSTSAGETRKASAILSKPSLESSAGSSVAASISRASRSRIALAYSVRLRRWSPLTAGIRLSGGRAIETRFEAAGEAVERRAIGARHAGWRHQAGAHLAHDLLPRLGVIAGLTASSPAATADCPVLRSLVVAGDAVLLDERLVRGRFDVRWAPAVSSASSA